MNTDTNYILASPIEKERLQIQARLWEPEVEALLDRIGVQPGWHCIDVGCGAMGILGPLSRRVGPRGRVVGIDTDPHLLAAARAYVAEEGLSNVEILERDARDSGLSRDSFDLAHARFVLVFGHSDTISREMVAITRPGGVVAVQETDQNSWCFYPPRAVWPRLKQVLEDAFVRIGGNANLGQQTLPLLRQIGLEEVQMRAASLALPEPHPYMRMPIIGANGFRQVIVGAGLMTETELDRTLEEMEAYVSDPETYAIWFTLTQVWGRKPLAH